MHDKGIAHRLIPILLLCVAALVAWALWGGDDDSGETFREDEIPAGMDTQDGEGAPAEPRVPATPRDTPAHCLLDYCADKIVIVSRQEELKVLFVSSPIVQESENPVCICSKTR